MSRIRVMHVISSLNQGGAEAMLVRLLRGLDPEVFSQSVVSLTSRGIYGDQIEAAGVPLLTLGMTGFASVPRSLIGLYRAIREQQPDVVQTWLYHADLFGLVSARLAGDAAVAWNVRCSYLAPGDVPRTTRLLGRLLARLSSYPDAVLFNSTTGREAHGRIGYHPRRIEVIPNGFDMAERRPDPIMREEFRQELGVPEGTFVVGMIARAHRMKDQSTFLAAAARLKGMARPIKFVMVGYNHDWRNRSLVAEIDQYGLRSRIALLGLRQDIPRVMAGLDCLVSTSTSEGFPNVIGEAMAAGVPCVATDAGDSRLIVGDTGIILPIADVAGVVAGVSHLMALSPQERRQRSERCRQRIAEHYELGHIGGRYAEFYRELRERRHHAPTSAQENTDLQQRFRELSVEIPVDARPPAERHASRLRRRLVVAGAAVLLLYALVFHSPLVWWAGNHLTIRQPPHHADAIVVVSGNGESTYINSGYQRRARDAAEYYKGGYAPVLVISSGIAQTFAEVELIRALLVQQGVPEHAIEIVPKYPRSTHENIEMLRDVLEARGARSILFVTAPYHSRRAMLIWHKVAPEIDVTTVPVIDTPPATPQWAATQEQIRAIGYEYLAIAHNRMKGWL